MSPSNTAERIKKLANEHKAFNGVHADLNLQTLGLEIHDYFYRVNTLKDIEIIENNLCYNHPFVLYRGRCYGNFTGIYIQYRIPTGTSEFLISLSEEMKEKGLIKNYFYVERDREEISVSIKSSLDCWDREKQQWIFNWEKWSKEFTNFSNNESLLIKEKKSIVNNLDIVDIRLLAQLTLDARKKNIDMIDELKLDKEEAGIAQRISRKLSYLKQNAVQDYRVFLNWQSFDLYQTILIRGFTIRDTALQLRNYLYYGCKGKVSPFPFESLFFLSSEGFIWYVRAPPSHLSQLMNFILQVTGSHDVYLIDYRYSNFYYLWDETFDNQKQDWKRDQKFSKENVIKELFS